MFARLSLVTLLALPAAAQVNPLDTGGPATPPIVNPLEGPQLTPNGGAVGPIVGGQVPGERAPAAAQLPAFLRPGSRLMYYQSESTVHNVPWHLVPNAFGNGLNWKQNNNAGTVSYLAIDMVAATPKLVAGNASKYIVTDLQRNVVTSSGANALLGNANNFDQFWIHPARLAQIAQGREPGYQANHVEYRTEAKVYKALAVMQFSDRNYASQVYDRESGLLLSATTADRGAGVAVPVGPGQVGAAAGAIQSHNYRFVGVRERNIPWANEPAPAFFAQRRQLQYTGRYGQNLPGAPMAHAFAQQRTATFTPIAEGVVLLEGASRRDVGVGIPQDSSDRQVYSSAFGVGAWVPPAAIAKLRPNQVIDEDPFLRFRTTFVGVQNNLAMFTVQGPMETAEIGYDTQSGLQTLIRHTTATAGLQSTQTSEMQLVGQR